jgi:hypothetical protein
MTVVRLRLTAEQTEQLTSLALQAARRHENAIFLAVTVPFWSSEDGRTVWALEVVTMAAKLGEKIKKLIRNGSNPV